MRKSQKIISFLLALVMVIGMVPPMAVHAEEMESTIETVAVETVEEETAVETTAATEEATPPTEAVTEPVEETTTPTEAVTEPVEETTIPTEAVTEPVEDPTAPTEEPIPEETVDEEVDASAPEEIEVSGTCGEFLTWMFQNGILTITGTGAMENYAEQDASPWYHLRAQIIAAEIGDGVTAIGDYAFLDCNAMTSITIPVSVTAISGNAFANCGALADIQYAGSPEQWDSITTGNMVSAVIGFGVSAQSTEDRTPDVGVSEDFLLPVDQITDVEDIPEGFTPIFDLEGLRAISNNTSGKYILMKDIHIEEGMWSPLWTFMGELEGNGHTISGLYSNIYGYYDVRWGLFTALNGAKISNLKVSGSYENTELGYVGDGVWVGGLAGNSYGDIQITNCVSEMTFNAATNSSYTEIITGGLIGRYIGNRNTATIKDCVYLGRIDSTEYGGMLGYCELEKSSTLTIENCRNDADIASYNVAGGILGYASVTNSTLNIESCRNDGNFSSSIWVSPDDVSGQVGPFGGILGNTFGQLSGKINISLCTNNGNFELGGNAGGIIGYSGAPTVTIASCVNTGSIENWYNAGGIAAGATGFTTIQDCLNTGSIWTKGRAYTGGIAGYGGEIKRCLNVGSVKTPAFSGGAFYNSGIVHRPWGSPTEADADASVVDCFWLDDGQNNTLYTYYQGLTGDTGRKIRLRGRLTAEELIKEESFPGFDFTNVWMMNPVLGHPVPVGIRLPLDLEIEEVGDNKAITLNYSGDTYAYFKSKPDLMYIYTLEGFPNERGTAQSQADGLIRIHLGHYREHGTFEGKITFTAVSPVDSINMVELDRPKTFDIKVTVTPLEFSQKYSVSLGVDGGLSLGAGAKFELDVPVLGTFGAEATLGKLQGGLGTGTALNISRSYSGSRSTLEITSEEADRKKVGVKSGIDGTILKADVDILTAGTESKFTDTGIYGFRIENFSPDNKAQRNAIGVYVLNEAMKSSPNNLAMQDFLDTQAKTVYKDANLDVISGTGSAVSTSFNGGVGSVEINNVPVVTVYDKEANASISVGQTHYSDGDKKYTTAFASDKTYSTLSNSLTDGKIAQDYFGREITMEAQSGNGEKALETTSLSAEAKSRDGFTVGTEYTTEYNRYRFTEKSLSELTASSAGIRSYFAGDQYAIGSDEFKAVGKLLSHGENPVEYSNVEKKQLVSSHELGLDGQLIVGVELGLSLSYLQEHEHTNASGFVVEDRKLETSRSDNLTERIGEKSFDLSNWLWDSIHSLGQKVKDFFTQVTGTIKDGAQTLWNWVTGNPDGTVNGIITLCTPSGADPWPHSHTLDISGTEGKQAVTMGRPAIISIMDNETGEAITDLSNEPLTFTMRYAAEELAALGGQVPALYRCSDDGKNLEYIGGVCNETDMTVTAEITKPGQYVLAVELHDDGSQEDSEETAAKILLDKDAVILKVGETAQLTAEVQLVELANSLIWSVSDDSVININQDGVVTARKQGTAYAIATVTEGETKFTARCRVDVVESEVEEQEKPAIRLNGVQLGTTKLTTELYSTDYAQFELLLELPQNVNLMSVDRKNVPEDRGVAIDSVRFTADTTAVAFDLVALDDRRIAVVPTEYALEYPEELAKTYKSAVTVWIDGEPYTTEEILTLTVKQSKPKLKAKIDTFNSFYTGQTQAISITGGTAEKITIKSYPDWLEPNEDGSLSLNQNAGKKNSGKVVLLVETKEWNIPAEVTLTVKNAYKAPGLKLNTSSVKIAEAAAKAGINLQLQPKSKKDTLKSLDVADVLAPEGYKVEGFNSLTGSFTLKAENGFQSGKITLQVKIDGTTETVPLTLKVEIVKKNISVSFKASGNLDLSLPNHTVTVKPTFKNYSGSFTFTETETEQFKLKQDGNVISVQCKEGTETGTYKLTLKLVLDDDITVENTVKITVKRTAIKLKLSSSKLSLNKSISDMASVTVTCTTKGYDITTLLNPKVMDKSGNNPSDGLTADYHNGKLTVSVNGNTKPDTTYKVLVKAYEGAPTATLTVTILKENKSIVTTSLKAKGSIDVIRNGTAITLTPSCKNAGNLTEKVEKLVFYKTVKKETTSADGLFAYTRNTDGTYTITKAEDAALDHSAKYSVKLVSTIGGTEVESKPIFLNVKQGSAKLTLAADSNILFSRDSRSRVNFSLTAKDVQQNDISEVSIKTDKNKYNEKLEIISYGNGEFALGFANNTVDERLKGKTVTVTLNIFLKGNEIQKANTTAKLKVTILK